MPHLVALTTAFLRNIFPIPVAVAPAKPPYRPSPNPSTLTRRHSPRSPAKPKCPSLWTSGRNGATCRMAAPEVRELAREIAGRGLVLKVNTEKSPTLAAQFRVQSIPYFVLLRGGIINAERTGAVPRAEMRRGLRRRREPRPVDASGRCELKTRPCPGSKINSPWRLALYGHRGVGI